jgi:hypothetical protein
MRSERELLAVEAWFIKPVSRGEVASPEEPW